MEQLKVDTEVIIPEGTTKTFKPYPVQPGFEEIKARMNKMSANMDLLAKVDTADKLGSDLNEVQLSFLVTNIVQSADETALENLLKQSPHLLDSTFSNVSEILRRSSHVK